MGGGVETMRQTRRGRGNCGWNPRGYLLVRIPHDDSGAEQAVKVDNVVHCGIGEGGFERICGVQPYKERTNKKG